MSYQVGPLISPSAPLAANQPLRGVWRRSATATALEIASGSLADTALPALFAKLDERLPRASLVRGSAPTYTDDTVTIDLVVNAHPPSGFNAAQAAQIADQLVTGLPLVSLDGRVRRQGEEVRAGERDTAAIAGQATADRQELGTWFAQLGSTAKWILAGVVVVVVIAGALYFLPRPGAAKKSG